MKQIGVRTGLEVLAYDISKTNVYIHNQKT